MSAFVLNRNYELILPEGYVSVENEEMEYVDGGWSGWVAAKNAWGYIQNKGFTRAATYAGLTLGVLMSWAKYGFTAASVAVGYQAAKVGAIVGGVIGTVLAVLGAAALLYWLGSERRYY